MLLMLHKEQQEKILQTKSQQMLEENKIGFKE